MLVTIFFVLGAVGLKQGLVAQCGCAGVQLCNYNQKPDNVL